MKRKNIVIIPAILFFGIAFNSTFAQSYLDINNVKALINYEGSFFYDFKTGTPGFEVPKGSGKHTIFASTLWIGGYDAGNNLHEAAQTYRQNNRTDYWAGPLDTLNLSTDTSGWQNTWKLNKSVIDYHRANYQKGSYVMPPEIKNWPANGTGSYDKVLAPFVDMNSNKIYDPASGDFPYIYGDQAVYLIMNDSFSKHTETKSKALGVEIHSMAFAFKSSILGISVANTIFVRCEIKNMTKKDYHDVYAGIWTDFDIGYAYDDYIGCDSARNMYFGYNGDDFDESVMGYDTNPPVQAVIFLNRSMSHFIFYWNDFGPNGNPEKESDYYYFLAGQYKNGQKPRYGGDGFNNVWDATRYVNYMFPGDPRQAKPEWSDASSGNHPGDRRGLGSIGPLNLKAGEVLLLDIAYVYVRQSHTNYLDVFDDLYSDADKIQFLYDKGYITNSFQSISIKEKLKLVMNIAPNPMDNYTVISFNNPDNKVFNLQITDLYGRSIYQNPAVKSDRIKLLRDEMKPGFYIVTLSNETSLGQIKLIVK